MRKLFLFFSFVVLVYFVFGFYLATFRIEIYESEVKPHKHELFHDYRGVSHVVTSFSKGSQTPPNILLAAAEANLSFLFFTDLNLIERPYDLAGYQGDVFTFSSQKMSYLDSHILVYSKNPDFYFDGMGAAHAQLHQHFSEPPNKDKSFLAILAHPFKLNHRWRGDYPIGLDGVEVINMRHLWQELWFKDRVNFVWSIFSYPWNPQLALMRLIKEPTRELELWDYLNKQKPTLGFLGNETTAKIFNIFGLNFTFPSYEKSFNFASNHILLSSELTGHVKSDREKIYRALANGNFYFSFDSIGNPEGFASYVKDGDKNLLMGSRVTLDGNKKILITELPKGLVVPTTTEIYKDGKLFFKSNESRSQLELVEPGQYRVVVKIQPRLPLPDSERNLPWIFTNPFRVGN